MRQYEGDSGKRVVRKIDLRLIPIMAILYLLAHIDRGNIGNAKIEGMDTDLGLVGNQYNIASTMFFVPYIIFEVPSNIILKKVRPNIWLSFLVIAWGAVMTCMGVVKNFQGLVACRVILVYIVSTWYPRHELQQRLAFFSGALSAGWRWIFLIEGSVTVAAGLVMPLLIIDTPEKEKWLSSDEKRFIDLRLRLSGVRTNTEEVDKISWKLLHALVDWKILLAILLAWANSVPTPNNPPYVCGGIAAWLSGRFSDRFSWRMPFIVSLLSVLVVGMAVLFTYSANVEDNVPAMYIGVVLAQIGIYPLLPGISAWTGNNLALSWKRSIGLAWLLAAGSVGVSLIGTNVFLDRESPRYATGYGTVLGIICLGVICALVLEFFLWRLNKAMATLSEEEVRERYTQEQLDAMGAKSPLYQYTLREANGDK
ncbi:major facilitator superfamily domain-containing protein [Aspergillus granulosus]|uniref:Major facilitator superfamily domain-containing protein n=1 Tax=Aspergillus granulosus TaxID=176169 RepID=A0ABR4HT77_9EURO